MGQSRRLHPRADSQPRLPSSNLDASTGTKQPMDFDSNAGKVGPLHRPSPTFAPPPYGDESSSALALPVARVSESSKSDGSSNDHRIFTSTTTTHTVSTTTTFFRLARRKKDKGPLFPLPPKGRSDLSSPSSPSRPRPSTDSSVLPNKGGPTGSDAPTTAQASLHKGQISPSRLGMSSSSRLSGSTSRESLGLGPESSTSHDLHLNGRPKATNLKFMSRGVDQESLPTPTLPPSARTSISTTGRPSLGGLFQIPRFRQNSEAAFPKGSRSSLPGTPGSLDSKHPSLEPRREPPIVLPSRQEGDTPARYLSRLEGAVNRSALVSLLTKSDDDFTRSVMRSYMRRFSFFEDPLDIAIRELLMHVELPKETQQIDRALQAFADRYHECNPGIFASSGKPFSPQNHLGQGLT